MSTATLAPEAVKSQALRTDMFKVPFSEIRIIDNFNIRKDYGDLRSLADSIRENGVKVAMRGYKKGSEWFVTDGHRRFAACKLLADEGINIIVPFVTESKGYNDEQRVIDMFITNDGKNLNPLEQSEGVRRLLNYGWTLRKISQTLGRSESYVGKLNLLQQAPQKFKNLIENGVISSTFALQCIADSTVNAVIDKAEAGELGSQATDEKVEMFEHDEDREQRTVAKQAAKITAKDLKKNNSWKNFKSFAKKDEGSAVTKNQELYNVLVKISRDEITMEDLQEMFMETA